MDEPQYTYYCIDLNEFIFYRFTDKNNILKFDLRSLIAYKPPYKMETHEEFKLYVESFLSRKNVKELTFCEFEKALTYCVSLIVNCEAEKQIQTTENERETIKEILSKPDSFYQINFNHEF